jgi:hypothetical protein
MGSPRAQLARSRGPGYKVRLSRPGRVARHIVSSLGSLSTKPRLIEIFSGSLGISFSCPSLWLVAFARFPSLQRVAVALTHARHAYASG